MDYPEVDPKSQPLDDLMSSTPGSRMIPIHSINSLLRDRCSGLWTFCHLFPALYGNLVATEEPPSSRGTEPVPPFLADLPAP